MYVMGGTEGLEDSPGPDVDEEPPRTAAPQVAPHERPDRPGWRDSECGQNLIGRIGQLGFDFNHTTDGILDRYVEQCGLDNLEGIVGRVEGLELDNPGGYLYQQLECLARGECDEPIPDGPPLGAEPDPDFSPRENFEPDPAYDPSPEAIKTLMVWEEYRSLPAGGDRDAYHKTFDDMHRLDGISWNSDTGITAIAEYAVTRWTRKHIQAPNKLRLDNKSNPGMKTWQVIQGQILGDQEEAQQRDASPKPKPIELSPEEVAGLRRIAKEKEERDAARR